MIESFAAAQNLNTTMKISNNVQNCSKNNELFKIYKKNLKSTTTENVLLVNTEDELGVAKAKAISLLHQWAENVRSLNAKALSSTATGPNDYLSMMTTKAMETLLHESNRDFKRAAVHLYKKSNSIR